jgi:hypothetical protein
MKRGLPVDDALCPAAEGRSSKDRDVVMAMAD